LQDQLKALVNGVNFPSFAGQLKALVEDRHFPDFAGQLKGVVLLPVAGGPFALAVAVDFVR